MAELEDFEHTVHFNFANAEGKPDGGHVLGIGFIIVWQRGPLTNGRNGAFLLDILKACETKLIHLQTGFNPCAENVEALSHISQAISALESRKQRRANAGTLGTHEKD